MTDMIDRRHLGGPHGDDVPGEGGSPELLTLCLRVGDTQQQDIATMQGWPHEWYDVSYAPDMREGAMHRMHHGMHDMDGGGLRHAGGATWARPRRAIGA